MPRAGHQSKQLGGGVEEIDDLGDEEEQESFAEVAQDPNHSKRHASKIAECVTNEHTRGIPGGRGQRGKREGHRGEGEEHREGRGRDQRGKR